MGKKEKNRRVLRWTARIVLSVFLLFTVLVLFIRSPWGQDILVSRVVNHISGKTNTKVVIDRLYLSFSGDLVVEGVFLEDRKGDTLLYSEYLEANLGIIPLVFNNELNLESVKWDHLQANISRTAESESFNYEFLMDALSPSDTTSQKPATEPLKISVGSLDLGDFLVYYTDEHTGVDSRIKLGALQLKAKRTDLETMVFEFESLNLSDSDFSIMQTPPARKQDSASAPLPVLRFGQLTMDNVVLEYKSVPDSINANFNIGEFSLELPEADLAANEYTINKLSLANSGIFLHLPGESIDKADAVTAPGVNPDFQWPQFNLSAGFIKLENNTVSYKAGNDGIKKEGFDPNNIGLSKLALSANDITYAPERVRIDLENLSFIEKGGFTMEHLSFDTQLDNSMANLNNLIIKTGISQVEGEVGLEFSGFGELLDSPEKILAKAKLSRIRLGVQDAFLFNPDLRNNEYLREIARNPVKGSLYAEGNLAELRLQTARFSWGDSTSLMAQGTLKDITDSLKFSIDDFELVTNRTAVLHFIPEETSGLSVPPSIRATGNLSGSIGELVADVDLNTTYGKIALNGNYQSLGDIRFNGHANVEGFRLDSLLKNEDLGQVGFNIDFSGSGNDMDSMDATFETEFSHLQWREYDFSNLELNGRMEDGRGKIQMGYKDDNLNLAGNSDLDLTTPGISLSLDLEVIGAHLQALGLTREDIRAAFAINADFKGTGSNFNLNARILNGIAVYDDQQYQLGDLQIRSEIDSVRTEINVEGDFLNGDLRSNTSFQRMQMALRRQFRGYFEEAPDAFKPDSIELDMNLTLLPNPILDEVFFRDIEKLDSIVFRAAYHSASKNLNAVLDIPSAVYRGSSLDSLHILVEGSATDLNFSAGLGAIEAGPVHIKNTTLSGNLKNRELLLDFSSFDGEERVMHIASELDFTGDTMNLHINPAELVLNSREWSIPENNSISIAKQLLNFQNMKISSGGQNLVVDNVSEAVEHEQIRVLFQNFRLQTFLSLLNPDEKLASGSVSGELVIQNPFGATGMVSNFIIDEFQVLEEPLGKLSFDGTSQGRSDYDFNMALKGTNADMGLMGTYTAAATGAQLNLDLELNRIDLKLIESFSNGVLEGSTGFVSGNIEVSGTTASPEYNGSLRFNDAQFTIASLNSGLQLSDELVELDTKGIYLDDFNLTDANGSNLTLDGSILTGNILNPGFDLKLDTENFQILNSTEEDNDLVYGIASLDADMTIKGTLDLPRIAGRLRIRKITDITYVVPESQMVVQERDGVVIFVNRDNPDAILTRREQEASSENFKGIDVEAILEIDKDAEFSIIIDERSGDNLKVSGDAALNLNIEPNGRTNLSGRYELQSGHYETSLYNLVNRRFEISPGSSITWQGDPMDAKLDVTAIYTVETSAAPLMATVTSGQGTYLAGQYRQVLPFLVYLNVDGELLEPELSFDLDMPEDEQGTLGGAVYSRVQQLNQQEAELNKQVFSLLALNRFYPTSGSDGSAGGTAAIARDNVNKVLSGELNAFSDQIFGNSGIELDFDLDSFTDYQGETPQDRTQLNINASKKLFDDRLIVTAGSAVDVEGSAQPGQEETPIIGNVSLEYLLTDNGRYRLRGFRKSEYENIIDGQLIVTGLALIFNREFNKFSELFSPLEETGEKQTDPEEEGQKN